jgi:hypothetical protein
MPARWGLLVMTVWLSAGSVVLADIWSPSTWLGKGNKKSVSVSKSSKKTNHRPATGHKPASGMVQGLASTPHDFLAKSREIISPSKGKPSNNSVSVKKNSSSKPSLLKSMFAPEPPPPPQTVKDWLSLKRPT